MAGATENSAAPRPEIAVILPCFNEESAVAKVVRDFRAALPAARIVVFDNNSTDRTAEAARAAGAEVRTEPKQGKGHVLRRAFAQLEADVYVMADGDGTYDVSGAAELVALVWERHIDMVVGVRRHEDERSYRPGHLAGNRLFNLIVRRLFGKGFEDILSGYRVLSRPFVKSFPALAPGFEIETEMCIHAIHLDVPTVEVPTAYGKRIEGTASKLRTWRDGVRILMTILRLARHLRPFLVFGSLAAAAALVSLALGVPVILEFLETGLVPRFPTAIAAASIMVIAAISFVTGVILDSVAYAQKQQKRLFYLSVPRERGHGLGR